jgi:hypothetical protein
MGLPSACPSGGALKIGGERVWKALSKHRCISNMYLLDWEPQGVSERRRGVKVEASVSVENQTQGGHSGQPLE